jgi:hypothetical protein
MRLIIGRSTISEVALSGPFRSKRTEEEKRQSRHDPDLQVLVTGRTTLLLVWAAGFRVSSSFVDSSISKDEALWYPLVVLPEMVQILAWTVPGEIWCPR